MSDFSVAVDYHYADQRSVSVLHPFGSDDIGHSVYPTMWELSLSGIVSSDLHFLSISVICRVSVRRMGLLRFTIGPVPSLPISLAPEQSSRGVWFCSCSSYSGWPWAGAPPAVFPLSILNLP